MSRQVGARERGVLRLLTIALIMFAGGVLAGLPDAFPADASTGADGSRPRRDRGPHAESRIYGLAYIEEDDSDGSHLQGVSLLWSNWDETVDWNGGVGLWLSAQSGDGQTVIGTGAEVTLLPWVPKAPWRLGVRFRLGVEHRRRDPDEGLGGLFGAGIEAAVWIGSGLQLAVTLDRELAFSSDDRTELGVSLRWARPRS